MNPAPNLVLIGPMGAGKTSIGKQLAARLGLLFVDADQRLEQITGATVPMIFEHEGEAGFRLREAQLIAELMQGRNQLIATGGGAILSADNRRHLHRHGYVVYLKASVAQQIQRLAHDSSRPLLASGDREEKLTTLANTRGPFYEQIADLVFDSDHLTVADATDQVCAKIQAQWQREDVA